MFVESLYNLRDVIQGRLLGGTDVAARHARVRQNLQVHRILGSPMQFEQGSDGNASLHEMSRHVPLIELRTTDVSDVYMVWGHTN